MFAGDKNQFAVEAHLSQSSDYVFIQYCFWVKNKMVGDIHSSTLLSSVIPILESIILYKDSRKLSELEMYKSNEIASYLIKELWDVNEKSIINNINFDEDKLKKLDIISNEGESFQGFYIFLIECKSYNWLIGKNINSEQFFDIKIPGLTFYKIIQQVLNWIKDSTILRLRSEYENK